MRVVRPLGFAIVISNFVLPFLLLVAWFGYEDMSVTEFANIVFMFSVSMLILNMGVYVMYKKGTMFKTNGTLCHLEDEGDTHLMVELKSSPFDVVTKRQVLFDVRKKPIA